MLHATALEDAVGRFRRKFAKSEACFARAKKVIPQGINSNLRHSFPYPIYVDRAEGAHKVTVDGESLVDYWMGHGSLLLGHSVPEWDEPIFRQLSRGRHFSAPTEIEISLAEKICSAVSFVERVRFCGTGSESLALAFRLSRAVTGKSQIVRFAGHYHGWYDELLSGILPFLDGKYQGVLAPTEASIKVVPPNDLEALRTALKSGTVAAVVLEPAGGMTGVIAHPPEFLSELRSLCDEHHCLLIFDEMVSGFRFALGGASEYYGVSPDLATYGKVLFGGFPGAALGGRAEYMDRLGPDPQKDVAHQGTWNAAPVAMAAGNQLLDLLLAKGTRVYAELDQKAELLRQGLREVLKEASLAGNVSGVSSIVHFNLGAPPSTASSINEVSAILAARFSPPNVWLRPSLLVEGIDFSPFHMNVLSAAHTEKEIEQTTAGFRKALEHLRV